MIQWILAILPLFSIQGYICGDAFRSYADHIYEEEKNDFQPAAVAAGETVFLKGAHLASFFSRIHPHINHPYILITHISDDSVPGSYASYLNDPQLIAWFGINHDGTPHPKMHCIPIGIANAYLLNGNQALLSKIQQNLPPKKYLSYLNFTIQSFSPERWPLFKLLSHVPFCHRTLRQDYETYLHITASSQFMISPRGLGLDTYRLWESLYLGTIPIVKTSSLDALYEGLPILIISDWRQVTKSFLEQKYEELSQKSFSLEKLSMEYWTNLIDSFRNRS